MRVYGALMWSLGKVLNTPEVMRVYIGSFNDKPINTATAGPLGTELFEKEQDDLLSDLKDIPKKACDRRVVCIKETLRFPFNQLDLFNIRLLNPFHPPETV
nr:EH domain-containing protein 1 [Tanacetum cinerariifolium]